MKFFVTSAIVLLPILAAGCGDATQTATAQSVSVQATAALPSGLILTDAPKQPLDVDAAKKSLKTGDDIVVRGRIGGRVEPFVIGCAVFQLVDSSVLTCDEMPMKCDTPWDNCCEPKDQLTAKSLTVQVVGANGKPLAINLKGQGGLNPMSRVVIRGKVDQKPDEKTMIVRADGIYVDTSPSHKPANSPRLAGAAN